MGEGSKFETGDRFRQTRGQKDRIQYGYPSEVIGEIESVLGGEEKNRQEDGRKGVKSAVSFLSRLLNPSNSSAKFFLLPYSLLHEQIDRAHRWCSLWRKLNGDRESLLTAWPLDRPENWLGCVNEAQTDAELEALRKCVNRGTPYGSENGTTQIAAALGLKYTLQARGRPRKVVGLTDTQM